MAFLDFRLKFPHEFIQTPAHIRIVGEIRPIFRARPLLEHDFCLSPGGDIGSKNNQIDVSVFHRRDWIIFEFQQAGFFGYSDSLVCEGS